MKQSIIIGLLTILSVSCISNVQDTSDKEEEILPSYNGGGYTINIVQQDNLQSDSILIKGKVASISKDADDFFVGTIIAYGCHKVSTDRSGNFVLKTARTVSKSSIVATSVGYRSVETMPIILDEGNYLLTINFYLAQDKRPIIDCQ